MICPPELLRKIKLTMKHAAAIAAVEFVEDTGVEETHLRSTAEAVLRVGLDISASEAARMMALAEFEGAVFFGPDEIEGEA